MGEEYQLCAKHSPSIEWRNTIALLRKSLIIEAKWLSTMFRTEN
jgi:hypothetical protein